MLHFFFLYKYPGSVGSFKGIFFVLVALVTYQHVFECGVCVCVCLCFEVHPLLLIVLLDIARLNLSLAFRRFSLFLSQDVPSLSVPFSRKRTC